jgi:hypothetical protein
MPVALSQVKKSLVENDKALIMVDYGESTKLTKQDEADKNVDI